LTGPAIPPVERPIFVDPPAVDLDPEGAAVVGSSHAPPDEPVYERTILPSIRRVSGADDDARVASPLRSMTASPLLLAGMVAAVAVVVAAVLLVVGVL
jgi:hypothetical protein